MKSLRHSPLPPRREGKSELNKSCQIFSLQPFVFSFSVDNPFSTRSVLVGTTGNCVRGDCKAFLSCYRSHYTEKRQVNHRSKRFLPPDLRCSSSGTCSEPVKTTDLCERNWQGFPHVLPIILRKERKRIITRATDFHSSYSLALYR